MNLMNRITAPRPDLDTARLRRIGLELQVLAAQHRHLCEQLRPLSDELAQIYATQSMSGDEGEAFRRAFIDFNQVYARLECPRAFKDVSEDLSSIGLPAPSEAAASDSNLASPISHLPPGVPS